MEQTFSQLKQKDVINITDGRHLGRVCDLTFSFPENHVLGFTVTGCKGFRFSKQEIFLPVKSVVKIGKDAVLVKFGKEEGDKCPPPNGGCPPKLPPPDNCPPYRPPNNCPPNNCPPQDHRSLDEYE